MRKSLPCKNKLVSDKFRLQHASQEEKVHTFQQSGSNDKHAIEVQAKTIQDLNFEKAALSRQLDEANKEQSKMSAEMDQLRVEAKNGENLPELISQATACCEASDRANADDVCGGNTVPSNKYGVCTNTHFIVDTSGHHVDDIHHT